MKDFSKNPFVLNMKKGLLDIKTAMQEGNFKLFLKQLAVIGVFIWLLHWMGGKFDKQISQNKEQIRSIETQQRSEQEYMSNKQLLISLEPRFPDISEKNKWLTSKILNLFKEAELAPQLDGTPAEIDGNPTFLLMSQGATTQAGYMQVGKFLERIENEPSYLRVSEVIVAKEAANLGKNKVVIRFNTIFPKQKIGPTLFKNYQELVAQQGNQDVALDRLPTADVAPADDMGSGSGAMPDFGDEEENFD